jgi:hypothetical protein
MQARQSNNSIQGGLVGKVERFFSFFEMVLAVLLQFS